MLLPLCLYRNHFDSASIDIRLVFSNLFVELSFYFQLIRLNGLASNGAVRMLSCGEGKPCNDQDGESDVQYAGNVK